MSFYTDPKFNKGENYLRPNDDTPVKIKETKPGYSLAWCKYIYSSHLHGRTGIPYKYQNRISNLRAYANGQQDPDKYKQYFSIEEQTQNIGTAVAQSTGESTGEARRKKGRQHFMDVDFNQIFSPAPKYVNNLLGRYAKFGYNVKAEATDKSSTEEKLRKKWSAWAKRRVKSDIDEVNAMRGLDVDPDELLPESVEELDIYEKMGKFKLQLEVALEQGIEFTSDISNEKELKLRVLRDIIITNAGAYLDKIDDDGYVRSHYADPEKLIIEYTDQDGFDKSRFFGYILDYRVTDLRNKFPDKTEDEIAALVKTFQGKYGNPDAWDDEYYNEEGAYGYDDFHIPVLYCAWVTTDIHNYTTRVNKKGEKIQGPSRLSKNGRPIDEGKNRTVEPKYIKSIRESKWVIGSEMVFDYGKMNDAPYDLKNKDVILPVHAYKIKGKSIMENMVPMLDQVQMTYLRLQNAIAKAPPPGLKIDIGKMKKITMGGKKWQPLDLIKLYTHTGHMLYDSSISGGDMAPDMRPTDPGNAIDELSGGMGNAVRDAISSFEMAFQLMAELTGVDRVSAVSAQDPRTSAAETKIAAAGTSDTLRYIFESWLNIKKHASQSIAIRLQIGCKYRSEIYEHALGSSAVKTLALAIGNPPSYYGIHVEPAPDEQEIIEIKQAAAEALKGGVLRYSEYLMVSDALNSGGNTNYVQAYLSMKESQAEKRQAEQSQAAQQMDTQKQQVTAQQKFEQDAALERVKTEEENKRVTHETDEEIRKLREESRLMPTRTE